MRCVSNGASITGKQVHNYYIYIVYVQAPDYYLAEATFCFRRLRKIKRERN